MSDLLLNRTIKHYRIEKVLGAGGMGAVYRAIDTQLQRAVAIKVMHPNFAIQPEFQQRFLQEARASAALDHPNIIRIYEFNLDNNMLYMVTELVSGGSLRDYLKQLYEQRKFIEVAEALALTRQVADALDYAHQQGLVHRDVKPDNVLLKVASSSSDESIAFRAILTDFGLAKLAEGGVQSLANNPTGTLPYMAPEQAMADKLDGRTDLYALGIMLYELTTGRLPFVPQNLPEAIKMHTTVAPDRPTSVRASLSPALEEVILKAMAKNPKDRYQSGAEFAKAIRGVEAVGGQVKRGAEGAKKQQAAEPVPEKVESLSTYLQSMAQAAAAPAPAYSDNTSANDRLVITAEGEQPRYFEITKNLIEIGRDPALDLSLNSAKVSRHHARLERRKDGQYTIMDVGSSNGTFLGDTKLLSNIPEVWTLDKTVRLGNFWLTLQRAARGNVTVAPVMAAPSVGPAGFAPGAPGLGVPIGGGQQTIGGAAQGGQGGVMMTLNPPVLTLEAGGRMEIRVEIKNLSELVEHYQFHVEGIPKEWFTLPMTTLQLMTARDGDAVSKGSVSIGFHPPRNCKSTSGSHNITIRVTSQDRGKEVGRAQAMLTINPYYQFEGDLQPKKIRNNGELRVVITNKGNAPESFTLTPRDREEALHFDPPTQSITVSPCLEEVALFYVRPTRRPWFGFGSKHYSYEVLSEASVGSSQALPAELIVGPRIPWFLLVLLLLLCLLCLLPILLLDPCPTNLFQRHVCAIPVPPNLTATLAHGTLDNWLTATANGFADRQTSTTIARNTASTATAVVQSTATGVAQNTTTAQAANITGTAAAKAATAAIQTQVSIGVQVVQQTQTAQAAVTPGAPK